MVRILSIVASALLIVVYVSSVSAHGDSPSLEAEVGAYLIDIGHEALAPRTDIEFAMDLFTKDPIEYAPFASVDVRITKDGAELETASLENDGVNVPVFVMNFPEPGGYDMDVRFLDGQDALIAARTFHLEVPTSRVVLVRDGVEIAHYAIAAGLFALSAGILGVSLWQRYRSGR